MGDVALDVGELEPMVELSTYKCLIFSPVNMDFCMRKIRQPTDMVKMHVGQDNVPDLFWFVSQLLDSIDRPFLFIKWHNGNEAE